MNRFRFWVAPDVREYLVQRTFENFELDETTNNRLFKRFKSSNEHDLFLNIFEMRSEYGRLKVNGPETEKVDGHGIGRSMTSI